MCFQELVRLCKPFGIYATVGKRKATATPTQMHAPNKERRCMLWDDFTSRSFDIEFFWVMTPCSLVGGYWYCGEICYLHLQDAPLFSVTFTLPFKHWRAFLVVCDTWYMFHLSSPPLFDSSNNISQTVTIIKILTMQFSAASCYFLSYATWPWESV
jgi:hypothetical protein